MQEVVRVLDDFLGDIEEILSWNDVLQEPEAFGYESVEDALQDIQNMGMINFMLRVYREEIVSLLINGKICSHTGECLKLVSMMEELEHLMLTGGDSAEIFFKSYEIYFFAKDLLAQYS